MQSFWGLNFLGGLTARAVDTAQTFTSQLSWKSAANRIMNWTCVSVGEVGEADCDLLHPCSSREWRIMPCMGASVQTPSALPVETSCPLSHGAVTSSHCGPQPCRRQILGTSCKVAAVLPQMQWDGGGKESSVVTPVKPAEDTGRCETIWWTWHRGFPLCLPYFKGGLCTCVSSYLPSTHHCYCGTFYFLLQRTWSSGCSHSSEKYKSRACTGWQNRAFYMRS